MENKILMNKKVLWISVASVATLGVAGFFFWRYRKKKKTAQKVIYSKREQRHNIYNDDILVVNLKK